MAGINDYSNTAGSNTAINGIDIAEGCSPAGINNAIRQLMADIADVDDGVVPLQTPDINGGTIDGAVIGGTTPAAGTFTTLTANTSITGTLATASQPNITSVGTLTSATVSGDLTVDTNTLYVDSANNNVGIGTSSPSAKVHIQNSDVAFTPDTNADFLIVENNGTSAVQIVASATNKSELFFSDTTRNRGGFSYNHNGDYLATITAGSERMRIDSSGNVGIGTSSPTSNLTVSSSTQYTGLHLRNGTNTFAKLIGFVSGNDGGGLTLATGGTEDIKLLSGTGLSFDGGSNYLDDYETGSFTPNFQPATSGSITYSSTQDTLTYTKIGRMVFIQGRLRITAVSSPTGTIRGTLPFAISNLDDDQERVTGKVLVENTADDVDRFAIYPQPAGSNIDITATTGQNNNVPASAATAALLSGDEYIVINYNYIAN